MPPGGRAHQAVRAMSFYKPIQDVRIAVLVAYAPTQKDLHVSGRQYGVVCEKAGHETDQAIPSSLQVGGSPCAAKGHKGVR